VDLIEVVGRVLIKKYEEISTDEIINLCNNRFNKRVEGMLEERGYFYSEGQYLPKSRR